MARPKKAFSKTIEEMGVKVRIFEREPGGTLRVERRDPVAPNGKVRKALGHRDRTQAEQEARGIARELAQLRLAGHAPTGPLALSELVKLYLHHKGPLLRPERFIELIGGMLVRHLGAGFPVEDFGQHHADIYLAARRSGKLKPDGRRPSDSPAAGTLKNEIVGLSAMCNWAAGFRQRGRPLLASNPIRAVRRPQEKNVKRPHADQDRYLALLAVADQVDPTGALRLMLVMARHTGRRINAILHLRRSDVLLTREEMRRSFADAGRKEQDADRWIHGGLRWNPEWDKCDFFTFSPLSSEARAAVDAYLRQRPMIGDAWLFPSSQDATRPIFKSLAQYYLEQAEKRAELAHLERGAWHPFRRMWASERRHAPVQDVMAAGGWRDVKALQTAYQAADAGTMFDLVELSVKAGGER
jgi:hypothetical protein